MIGGQGEGFCAKSASDEKAHRPPAESKALHGNQQSVTSGSAHVSHLFVFRFNECSYGSISFSVCFLSAHSLELSSLTGHT
ncbi:hypothetical protein DC421_23780 [Priestia megaterium]|nr:hypothetical protein C0569_14645 [Priestia megaterium]PVE65973.1 hypothetical protein DC428_21495 [Priestia megaterium]PVE80147.1 hypothetical protein DC421_23780 [Priestia megaterium]PVE85241.1 hypothetical protein DC426_19445 [Priestia megaterium]PVE99416.1 hypothetical protein DC433_13595 [Priestia megaterium]